MSWRGWWKKCPCHLRRRRLSRMTGVCGGVMCVGWEQGWGAEGVPLLQRGGCGMWLAGDEVGAARKRLRRKDAHSAGIKEDIVIDEEWTTRNDGERGGKGQPKRRETPSLLCGSRCSHKIYSISLHQNKYVYIQTLMATQQHPSI